MFIHVVSEIFEQSDFFRECFWKNFEGMIMLCSISFYILYIPKNENK